MIGMVHRANLYTKSGIGWLRLFRGDIFIELCQHWVTVDEQSGLLKRDDFIVHLLKCLIM